MIEREEGYNRSESGNWNVASDYARLKIMKPLYLADEYADIARYGTGTLLEELENQIPVDVLRLKGLDRLISTLIKLIDNSKFAIKNKTERDILETKRKELIKIQKIFPTLSKFIVNQIKRTKEVKIISENFEPILAECLEIKATINEPLNKAHLIFVDKEEIDPRDLKKQIFEDVTNRG